MKIKNNAGTSQLSDDLLSMDKTVTMKQNGGKAVVMSGGSFSIQLPGEGRNWELEDGSFLGDPEMTENDDGTVTITWDKDALRPGEHMIELLGKPEVFKRNSTLEHFRILLDVTGRKT